MRLIVGVLACVAASAVTVAVADPPAAPAAAPAASASATPTPAAAQSAKTSVPSEESALLAAGFKPQMKGGQKVWCREEQQTTGTRLSRSKQSCNTAEALKEQIKNGREIIERAQNNQQNKFGG